MEMLRKLQLVETNMLRQFDTVCRKYQIPYFVTWGTALGAKRHKGFIPWDDDIDVGMLRSDYLKLKNVPQSEWGDLKLVDGETECFYHEKVFPRLYKPGTVFEPDFWKKYTYNKEDIKKPVWIDIFLFDYVDSKEEAIKKAERAYLYHFLYYSSKYWTNIVPADGLKRMVVLCAKNILHLLLLIKSPKAYLKAYYNLVKKDSGNYLISFDNWSKEEMLSSLCTFDELFPARNLPFEDINIMGPNKIDMHLERLYGDYMKLPPEEKRVGHLPRSIYLGDE